MKVKSSKDSSVSEGGSINSILLVPSFRRLTSRRKKEAYGSEVKPVSRLLGSLASTREGVQAFRLQADSKRRKRTFASTVPALGRRSFGCQVEVEVPKALWSQGDKRSES